MKKIFLFVMIISVILLQGCSRNNLINIIKKQEPKDIYNEYLQENLIPEYGMSDLSTFSTMMTMQDGNIITEREIYLNGISAAYIDDLNGDGVDDLLVLKFEHGEELEYAYRYYELKAIAYTIEDGKVKFLDKISVGPNKGHIDEYIEPVAVQISERETSDYRIMINAITDGEKTYIMLENICVARAFADGMYESYTAFELEGEDLRIAFSFEQSSGGSSGFAYTGYDEQSTLLYNTMTGIDAGEERGQYDSYDTALIGFFKKHGISVKVPVMGESIILSESLKNNILLYELTSSDINYDGEWPRALFTQEAYDYTEVANIADGQ